MIAALARPVQPRLVDAALDDRYLALLVQILDAAVLQALAHRPLDQCLGPAQEPLAIGQALASRIEAAVDDVHGTAGTPPRVRSEEHTSELQSLMRISYAVFCLKKKKTSHNILKKT